MHQVDKMILALLQMIEYTGCFRSIVARYSASLNTIQLELLPNTAAACNFQKEVQLEIFFNNKIPSQRFIYDNYDFAKTTEIRMTNVQIDTSRYSVLAAFLNISTLSAYTVDKIDDFLIQYSALDQCFKQDSSEVFSITTTSYEFNISLTNACIAEIQAAYQFQISFASYAETIEIDISQGRVCSLYTNNILHCSVAGDFTAERETPLLAVTVLFSMKINGIGYSTQHSFSKVQQGYFSGIFSVYNRVIIQPSVIFVYVIPLESLAYQVEELSRSCQQFVFRFTAKDKLTEQVYQQMFELEQYNVLRNSFAFLCSSKSCLAENQQFLENMDNFDFSFDVSPMQDGKSALFMYQKLQISHPIFSDTLVSIKGHIFKVTLYLRDRSKLDFSQPIDIKVMGVDNGREHPELFSYSFTQRIVDHEFEFDCAAIRNCEPAVFLREEVGLVLTFDQNNQTFLYYNYRFARDAYQRLGVIVSAVGALCVALCLYDTVSKVLLFNRAIRSAKRHKAGQRE